MILKTTTEKTGLVIEAVKEQHSYDCPCVVAIAIENGNQEFLNWIDKEVV